MTTAPWSMTEEGEWILNEPYASEVDRIKKCVTYAFNQTLYEELSRISPYSEEELEQAYLKRITKSNEHPTELMTGFVVEAMSGDL